MKNFLSILITCALILSTGISASARSGMAEKGENGKLDCYSCHNEGMAGPVPPPPNHYDNNIGNCFDCHNEVPSGDMPPDHSKAPYDTMECTQCHGKTWDLTPTIIDDDGDGHSPPEDCNDNDATIYPGAEDICGDGIDQDCSGENAVCPENPTPPEDPTNPGCGRNPDNRPTLPGCGEFASSDFGLRNNAEGTVTAVLTNFPKDSVAAKILVYPSDTDYSSELLKKNGAEEGFAFCKPDGKSVFLVNAEDRKNPATISGGRHLVVVKIFLKRLRNTVAATTAVVNGDTTLQLDFNKMKK